MCEGSLDVGKYLKNFTITNNNNKKNSLPVLLLVLLFLSFLCLRRV